MNKVSLFLTATMSLLLAGTFLLAMGDTSGVCIGCAIEHGYYWQIEYKQSFTFAGIVVSLLALLPGIMLAKTLKAQK